jgi:hypothetical protein
MLFQSSYVVIQPGRVEQRGLDRRAWPAEGSRQVSICRKGLSRISLPERDEGTPGEGCAGESEEWTASAEPGQGWPLGLMHLERTVGGADPVWTASVSPSLTGGAQPRIALTETTAWTFSKRHSEDKSVRKGCLLAFLPVASVGKYPSTCSVGSNDKGGEKTWIHGEQVFWASRC